ncbi:hydroxyacid dehydrogenase, partial [Mesorhizobium sp. M7A.F.Ca.CA.001.08.2.1]
MSNSALPLVISAPEPRTLDLIFTARQLARLKAHYRIVETTADGVAKLPADVLAEVRYIIGQPPISPETLDRMKALR